MRWFYKWRSRLASFFKRSSKDDELALEIEQHVEFVAAEYEAEGLAPDVARRKALREFGNVELLKEECRDNWGMRVIYDLIRDVGISMRVLWKSKLFTAAAIISLALCIGCNVTMFSMFYNLVLRPLPFPKPDRVVEIYNTYPKISEEKGASSIRAYNDYRENTDVFSDLSLVFPEGPTSFISNSSSENVSAPTRINLSSATGEFFDVLGIQPHLGTFFLEEDLVHPAFQAIVISHSFWQSVFGGDLNVVGKSVTVSDRLKIIRGVAPKSFEVFYPNVQVVESMTWADHLNTRFGRYHLTNSVQLFGRLKPGVSIQEATLQVRNRDEIYNKETPGIKDFIQRTGHKTAIGTLQEERVSRVKPVLVMLQLGAVFVFVIGCINLGNLLLVRANDKLTEFSIRRALGARLPAVCRIFFVESFLLTTIGTAIGLFVGICGLLLINAYAMEMLPPMLPLTLDANTLLFTLGVGLVCGMALGLIPCLRVLRANLIRGLHQKSRGISSGRFSKLVSSVFNCSQIALAVVLLVGAGLLLISFGKMLTKDLGFDPEGIVTLRIAPSNSKQRFSGDVTLGHYQKSIVESLRTIPGVSDVCIAQSVPMTTTFRYDPFYIYGFANNEGEEIPASLETNVSPNYFETMGIKLIEGNTFSRGDLGNKRREVIIDRTIADRYFPEQSAIGRNLSFQKGGPKEKWPIIVGVVEEVQNAKFGIREGAPTIYQNVYQWGFSPFSLIIRNQLDPDQMLSSVRSHLRDIDPSATIFLAGPLKYYVSRAMNNHRAVLLLLCTFASIAVILSVIGIYGVITYSVSQRRKENGIRAAIGAEPNMIMNLFLKRGFIETSVGLIIGLVSALFFSRFTISLLYEVKPTEAPVYVTVAIFLFLISISAFYIPARKAALANPMIALRQD